MAAQIVRSERRVKRRAIEIVAQLPEDPVEAMRVLKAAEKLVETFLAEEAPQRLVRLVS